MSAERDGIKVRVKSDTDGASVSISETRTSSYYAESQEKLLGVLEKQKSSFGTGATLGFIASVVTGVAGALTLTDQLEATIRYRSGSWESYLEGLAQLGVAYLFWQHGNRQQNEMAKIEAGENKIKNLK